MTANRPRWATLFALVLILALLVGSGFSVRSLAAHSSVNRAAAATTGQAAPAQAALVQVPMSPSAACTGGTAPSVEGTTLPNCYQRNITVGGNARIIRVWYTTDMTAYTVGGEIYVHGVVGESQASDVADAVAESWQAVFNHSAIGGHPAHEPYIDGCSGILNIQLRDGKGWAGIAYWGSPGNCNIGIDAPMVSDGVGTDDDSVVFHEIQHYTQYSYNSGCYADFQPLYSAGNAWIEGWSNWAGSNATNAATDAAFWVDSYDSSNSYYDLDYVNLHAGYLIQQYGGNGAPGDPAFGIKAVYEHYRKCDQFDDIFVMDETIQSLTGGAKNEKWAFVDFQAAYYAHPYANATTQPELVFPDTDDRPTSSPGFSQNTNMSGGSQSWADMSTEDWTGKYYRINPQAGCPFVELHVETQPAGGEVGINFIAANTTTPTVQRSAHIGDNATRMFAGFPANNQLVVNVTSFDSVMSYVVKATCVTPTINIVEPIHNPGHAMVGAPNGPIATLTRFRVTSSGLPVSGIVPSSIAFEAEGAVPTLVAGSFQEVGPGEYWAAIVPPTKPVGTTFVDYKVCLNTTICDLENDALLYVDPGNVDTVYLFDESGSMATEDTPGEGTRITNAKRAGLVLADMLRPGDRIGIIGHGGLNSPANCGLPGGTGNCPDASITRLARINSVAVPGDIAAVKAGVNAVTDRSVWTNTGRGLLNAKDMLLAGPANTSPDHIILLSDGQENVNPLYNTAAVRDVLQAAGVCVDTIGLGPEAPGALLAQIAAQNCGNYQPVPTSGLGTSRQSEADLQASLDQLAAMGTSAELLETMAAVAAADFYPGQLGIANANEYIDSSAEDSSRLFHNLYKAAPASGYKTTSAIIDDSVESFRFVVVGKQAESANNQRLVELLPPGEVRWLSVSPRGGATPAAWDIRNDLYQDVVVVKDPQPGKWGFRVRYTETSADYIMNLSAQTTIRLEGNLLNLSNGRAAAGAIVPIVATLMDHKQLLPGANVLAAIYNEGGTNLVMLLDDGDHYDGAAGDGIYGFPYSMTSQGGSYSVRVLAQLPDPTNPSENLYREWNGGFWVDGPQNQNNDYKGDSDRDGMPDDWERRCKLNVGQNDAEIDTDRDGLTNFSELERGTSPCDPDTDNGGERDGSEVVGQRNPLYARDDRASRVRSITLRPLNASVAISWSQRADNNHINVVVCVSTVAGSLGNCQSMDNRSGDFLLRDLKNGQTYYLTLYGQGEGGAQGVYSDQLAVKPSADPIPPQGAFFIGGPSVREGGDVAVSRNVTLLIDAVDTDSSYNGPAGLGSHSIPHGLVTPDMAGAFEVSGNVQMRFANTRAGIAAAKWETLAPTKSWTLGCADRTICVVYGQFRDGAGNESLIIDDRIQLRLESSPPNAPSITKFSPARALTGKTVVISGKNLTGATQVTFNGAAATFTVVSATQIRAIVPVNAATGKIGVVTPNGSAVSAKDFIVIPPKPTITNISPTVGPIGTQVLIEGTNFSGATSVKFGTKTASFVVTSNMKIMAVVPAGAKTGVISVTTPGGTVKSKQKFTVR